MTRARRSIWRREPSSSLPEEAVYWTTLGAAYYRAGDWKEAVAALEKSSELPNGDNGFNWFFLAMSHEKLGDKEKARQWYDRAIQWKDKNQAAKEKLLRLREEAARVLGMDRKRDEPTRGEGK